MIFKVRIYGFLFLPPTRFFSLVYNIIQMPVSSLKLCPHLQLILHLPNKIPFYSVKLISPLCFRFVLFQSHKNSHRLKKYPS